jgi:hypothetical protein
MIRYAYRQLKKGEGIRGRLGWLDEPMGVNEAI